MTKLITKAAWLSVTYVTGRVQLIHIPIVFDGSYIKKLSMMGYDSPLGISMVLKPLGIEIEVLNIISVELVEQFLLGSRVVISTDQLISK